MAASPIGSQIATGSKGMGVPRTAAWFITPPTGTTTGTARAQGFPDRPLRMLVGYAAGGTTDIVGRLAAEGMAAHLGQQVVARAAAGRGASPPRWSSCSDSRTGTR